jgi:hypothetical protein
VRVPETQQLYAPSARVYQYRHGWGRDYILGFSAFILFMLLQYTWEHERFLMVLLILSLLTNTFYIAFRSNALLIFAPDGITYYGPTQIVFARWQDVFGAGRAPAGFGPYSGLLLQAYQWWPRSRFAKRPKGPYGFIPIHGYNRNQLWEPGIWHELRYHAPWLFAPPASDTPHAGEHQPQQAATPTGG